VITFIVGGNAALREATKRNNAAMSPPPGLLMPPGLVCAAKKSGKYNAAPIPVPPGLEPPRGSVGDAGLHRSLRTASVKILPGLHMPAPASVKGAAVRISCLPNHILSDAMMGATLEQAQLDKFVLSFVTRPGVCRGEAIVTLTSAEAAIRCAQHFHGRRWDVSGVMVTAKLLPQEVNPFESDGEDGYPSDEKADPRLDDLQLLASYEARVDREGGWDDRNLETFGVDSCDHDDLVSQVFGSIELGKKSMHSSVLSAKAPAFVPGKMLATVCEDVVIVGSDVSTEDGDSVSSCDEKDGGAVPEA